TGGSQAFDHALHGFDGGIPPVARVLLAPKRLRMITRVEGGRFGQDLAAVADGQGLGARRSDIDAQEDHSSPLRWLKRMSDTVGGGTACELVPAASTRRMFGEPPGRTWLPG